MGFWNGIVSFYSILEKIFIPFFSTKKSGSGIGLSLCKQIMMLHKGSIQVQSVDGEGTAFLLQF
jgi:signal transduction histidine kinase